MRVLIAEDDQHIRAGLSEILDQEGYTCVTAADGQQALTLFKQQRPDFVCLDIMMPGLDGYALCREIRQLDASVPVIFISAKSEEIDKVLGLEMGADDFIVKPFGVREVVARIRAITRRTLSARQASPAEASFSMGDLDVYPRELRARRKQQIIDLSVRDIKLLQFFYQSKGQALHRDALFNACWGINYVANSRSLDQQIAQLRKRIELDPKSPVIIRTVHGVGYRYED